MSTAPLVSIVIPTKNRSDLLRQALDSLRAQTYPNWEALIVDDGSTDDTPKVLAEIAAADPRFRPLRNPGPRHGASASRNFGERAAAGKYVIFLDSDDALAPSCLERRVQVMEEEPALDFAVFPTRVFLEKFGDSAVLWNIFTAESDLDRFLRLDVPWQTAGPIWRKASLARVGPWDERIRSWQDWEFHIRALLVGSRYRRVPEPDSYWRSMRPGSISHAARSHRFVANRVAMLKRIVRALQQRRQMTPVRRRIFVIQFYRHSFGMGLPFRWSRRIFWVARELGLMSALNYLTVLAWQMVFRAADKLKQRYERRYPEFYKFGPWSLWTATAPMAPGVDAREIRGPAGERAGARRD
jgi:glycosyltransferase involved in cell wall biosynthesis